VKLALNLCEIAGSQKERLIFFLVMGLDAGHVIKAHALS
jgi:hypothetical protein